MTTSRDCWLRGFQEVEVLWRPGGGSGASGDQQHGADRLGFIGAGGFFGEASILEAMAGANF